MEIRCPECKRKHIISFNKKTYFLRAALYLAVILFCCWFAYGLIQEGIDPVVILGVLGSFVASAIALIMFFIYVRKGILFKGTSYKCKSCQLQFKLD